ncbi:hypothetical protein JD844_000125 [Phrynosoma platyrhinos]|uniref:FAM192A/Fyv6 N-terminal domain-containing protein n=1 Tax=Phrynosoma platyrhinos TaxID=52577 RepID=A0ABQ7SQ34_PHRPL|nr:hypothetical protein JD844_000125 [Phrynosoma platyrhinos]
MAERWVMPGRASRLLRLSRVGLPPSRDGRDAAIDNGYTTMDGGESSADLVINKRFVSEAELEERRKRRQEEWEKVRKPEDPEECPEEVYDPRSLYERLQEQKDKKQQEFEEQFKFKNMVRGLDEDETKFLDEVSRQQALIEKQRRDEDLKELSEYRISFTLAKVGVSADLKKETEKKLSVKSAESKSKFSQAKLLAGAVKHRSSDGANSVKRLKLDPDPDHDKAPEASSCIPLGSSSSSVSVSALHCPSAAVCIGILPGLGAYSGSSDSESSSDSEGTINSTGKIVSSVFRGSNYFDNPL